MNFLRWFRRNDKTAIRCQIVIDSGPPIQHQGWLRVFFESAERGLHKYRKALDLTLDGPAPPGSCDGGRVLKSGHEGCLVHGTAATGPSVAEGRGDGAVRRHRVVVDDHRPPAPLHHQLRQVAVLLVLLSAGSTIEC